MGKYQRKELKTTFKCVLQENIVAKERLLAKHQMHQYFHPL